MSTCNKMVLMSVCARARVWSCQNPCVSGFIFEPIVNVHVCVQMSPVFFHLVDTNRNIFNQTLLTPLHTYASVNQRLWEKGGTGRVWCRGRVWRSGAVEASGCGLKQSLGCKRVWVGFWGRSSAVGSLRSGALLPQASLCSFGSAQKRNSQTSS